MAIDYEITDSPAVAILHAVGPIEISMWQAAMERVLADRRFVEGMPILLDVTQVGNLPQPGETAVAAIRWRALAPRSRGAIVAAGEAEYQSALEVESITGARIRAFRDRASAIRWLVS